MVCLGSGKSTIAKSIPNSIIISTDKIREEITGKESNQDKNILVFDIAYNRIKFNLTNNKYENVIFDATNINYKRRIDLINKFRKYADEINAYLILTPYEECLERNNNRERKVPEEVIKKMYMNFYIPQIFEGFDNISINYNTDKIFYMEELKNKLNIPHDNPNHELSILEHSDSAYLYLENKFGQCALTLAGYLHDIGKPFCKTFINSKGEKTEIAHYYSHEKVGAYDSLFYTEEYALEYQLYIAQLIQWHMLLHDKNLSEKTILKYQKLFGEEFWNDLQELHKADLTAH